MLLPKPDMGKKKKRREDDLLREELDTYLKMGIGLSLDGKPSTPGEIVRAHRVAEEGCYMRDYVQNEKGEVERVDFDLIKKE